MVDARQSSRDWDLGQHRTVCQVWGVVPPKSIGVVAASARASWETVEVVPHGSLWLLFLWFNQIVQYE
jgi:hypothetical protein